jgi:NitT/TauT family transport system substrate-binding protein
MLLRRLFASFVLATSLVGTAAAADKVNVASSLRGFWDTTMVQFGQERGFFASEGLDLNIFWTDGGSDILQVVNSGSVDIGIGTGVMGALGAYARGAPLRIIANEFVGSSDLYYFVRSDSSVLSFKDLEGKNVGVARLGSSSESVGGMLAKQYNVRVKFTPTGGTAATMTQVMTKQVDAAWCVFPVFLQQIDKGEIRVIALGKNASGIAEQTTRVNIASKSIIENRPEVLRRFLRAYRRTIDLRLRIGRHTATVGGDE